MRTVDPDPQSNGDWEPRSVRSGVGGTFRFEDLSRTEDIQIAIRAPGYGAVHRFLGMLGKAETDLGEVALPAAHVLTGLIENGAGEALAGAVVMLRRAPGDALDSRLNLWLEFRKTVTDSRGRFLLVDLAPGAWEATIRAGNREPISETVTIGEEGGTQQVRWRVQAGGLIRGRVRAAGGEPLPGVGLSLRILGADKRVFPRTKSADDGSFEFTDLAAGRWSLAVTPTGEQLRAWERTALPEVMTDGPYLEIELPPANAWIEGRVVDAWGASLAQVLVVRDPGDGSLAGGVLSGSDGGFRIRSTSVGPTTLHAYPTMPMGDSEEPGSLLIEWHHRRDLVNRSTPAATIRVQAPLKNTVLRIGD